MDSAKGRESRLRKRQGCANAKDGAAYFAFQEIRVNNFFQLIFTLYEKIDKKPIRAVLILLVLLAAGVAAGLVYSTYFKPSPEGPKQVINSSGDDNRNTNESGAK